MSLTKPQWKTLKDGYVQSLVYMEGRKNGEITSIKTPWKKFNDATTDGLEWNSITVIAGRPGSGKTAIKDQIIRELPKLNPSLEYRVLEFQLEMVARTSAIREYTSVLGKSYKYLCSADGKLTDTDLEICYEYAKLKVKQPIDVIDNPLTVLEFKEQIQEYMRVHSTKDEEGNVKYVNTIVTLDHSILLKKSSYEKDKMDTLYNLGETLTELKKLYPIAFIILSQLSRAVENPERNEDGKYGNFILDSDVFGADALLQHCDTLIGINRPALRKIKYYGPDRYIIQDDNVLVLHFLKCRNGDTRMSFFKAEFSKMSISEMQTPPTQAQARVATKY